MTLQSHSLVLGVVMVLLGTVMLFYGILMTHLVIFLATYCLCLAVLVGVATAFLSANSSSIAIYFTLLLIVALSTLAAYALTRLVKVSLFFVGGSKHALTQFSASCWPLSPTPSSAS